MIDIGYLRVLPKLSLSSGLEFLDWQDNTFFQEVARVIDSCYNTETQILDLSKKVRETLANIIKKHTNLRVTIVPEQSNNLAIDAGFISPNNVLNNKLLDEWVDKKYTKIAQAHKDLKKNVLKGYCDLKTGKVEGDFADINFNIYINVNIVKRYGLKKDFEKSNVTAGEAIGAAVLHECGHAFFNLHYISSHIVDNALLSQSVKLLINEPDKNRRAVIVKELNSEIDIKVDTDFVAGVTDPTEIYILFSKGIKNRDYRRSFSLGITSMTAEVLADAYAIRMGASRGLAAIIAGFNKKYYGTAIATIIGLHILAVMFPVAATGALFAMGSMVGYIQGQLFTDLTPTIYDTPYRRLKTMLRENIAYLNTNAKSLPATEVKKFLEESKNLNRIVEENKPFFESTAMQRMLGWLIAGSDFRKTDFEHYTADLTSSALALQINLFEGVNHVPSATH